MYGDATYLPTKQEPDRLALKAISNARGNGSICSYVTNTWKSGFIITFHCQQYVLQIILKNK